MHPKTFAKLPQWTSQQVFDYVVNALRKQGKPSVAKSGLIGAGTCKYRGPKGLKCAVGHLIPLSIYSREMEGNNMSSLHWKQDAYPELAPLWPHSQLLSDLQAAHDDWGICGMSDSAFEKRLRKIALERGLIYSPVPQESPA